MKNNILVDYTFNASARTITLNNYTRISVEMIGMIKNLTTGQTIYSAIDPVNYGGTVSGNVLTFTASNAGMANTDKLMIVYDIDTKFTFSPIIGGNSTVSQLAPGATFTGTYENITTYPAYSILFFSDQNATITVNQALDSAGTKKTLTQTYSYLANGQFSISYPVNGDYIQVIVQNTGGSTTTALQLETAYGQIQAATKFGNLPIALNEVNGLPINLGQNTMANSLPMTFASDQTSLPVKQDIVTATGNITTQNLTPTASPTAGSSVTITLANQSACAIAVSGTYTGALSCQYSINGGTTWVTITYGAFLTLKTNASQSGTIASASVGVWNCDVTGLVTFRVSALAAVTGTAIVSITATNTSSLYSLPLLSTVSLVGTITTLSQFVASAAAAHATANPTTTGVRSFGMNYNGSTWDLALNNSEATLLASAARTTTQTSADIVNYNAQELIVVLDMTVVGTGSVTVSIDGKDSASGKYYNILTSAPITTNSTNRYRVGRDLVAVANTVAQDYLPRVFRIVVTANNANSATYSVGYNLSV